MQRCRQLELIGVDREPGVARVTNQGPAVGKPLYELLQKEGRTAAQFHNPPLEAHQRGRSSKQPIEDVFACLLRERFEPHHDSRRPRQQAIMLAVRLARGHQEVERRARQTLLQGIQRGKRRQSAQCTSSNRMTSRAPSRSWVVSSWLIAEVIRRCLVTDSSSSHLGS